MLSLVDVAGPEDEEAVAAADVEAELVVEMEPVVEMASSDGPDDAVVTCSRALLPTEVDA